MDLNRVLLTGTVAAVPEVKVLASGSSVTTVVLTVRRPAKRGEALPAKEDAVPVEAWGEVGEAAARLVPGDRAIVDAIVRVNAWTTADGSPRSRLVLMATTVVQLPVRSAPRPPAPAPARAAAPVPADSEMPF